MWSVPFAGAVAERGAEFILPHDRAVGAVADRLGLALVRKGTLYGNREPRGGSHPVSGAEVLAAVTRLGSAPGAGALADVLGRGEVEPDVAEAIRARFEVSCAYPADDLDSSVLTEGGAGAFGDFDTWTVEGGNDRIARELAAGLHGAVRLSAPVSSVAWRDGEVRVVAGGREAAADAAVIAVPASVLSRVAFDPPLPRAKTEAGFGRRRHRARPFRSQTGSGATRSWPPTAIRCRSWARSRARPARLNRSTCAQGRGTGWRRWGVCAPTSIWTSTASCSQPGRTIRGCKARTRQGRRRRRSTQSR